MKLEVKVYLQVDVECMPSIIQNIEQLIFNCNPQKGYALENVINYAKDCWNDLFAFMEDGYEELTNNVCERAVKPFCCTKKSIPNFWFLCWRWIRSQAVFYYSNLLNQQY